LKDEDNKKLLTLAGMACVLGVIFPSPMLGMTLVLELASPPKSYMEHIIVLSVPAVITFSIYYALAPRTGFIDLVKYNYIGADWSNAGGLKDTMIITAFLIGVVSAALSLLQMFFFGLVKQIFKRIQSRLPNKLLKTIVPPVIGGIIIGTVNWAVISFQLLSFCFLF
jgi:H+/Cl- antiporter ClcA